MSRQIRLVPGAIRRGGATGRPAVSTVSTASLPVVVRATAEAQVVPPAVSPGLHLLRSTLTPLS